jgi:putative peptide zinc metalloprotease protein
LAISVRIEPRPSDALLSDPTAAGEPVTWARLLDGTEAIGQASGSGLREPPYLVRRCDGQVVQLSHLLYVIASQMDGRNLAQIADSAATRLDLRVTPEHVAYAAEHKLAPLGLVAYPDGRAPVLERRNALLALRFRAGLVDERTVNRIGEFLAPFFLPPIVIGALAALAGCDVWLASSHGIGAALRTLIHRPALGLALFALVMISLLFHECGHAAACRYGGARPGRIGIGIYLVWPVFFTDVTDSYRLTKPGRLRTDLGGVYFNGWFALAAAAAYFATGFEPFLVVVVSQQILILDQFLPWVRLDGYHIVSDLIGVSDLFARIRPVLTSTLHRRPDPRVAELKPWARVAVTTWVISTLVTLTSGAAVTIVNLPAYLGRAWQSLIVELNEVGHGARIASLIDVLVGATGTIMLLLPVFGITLTYLLLCRRTGISLAARRARVDLTPASRTGNAPPPQRSVASSRLGCG